MKCPVDNQDLQISSRQGVDIHYCPECRGVWLHKAELDKVVEVSRATGDDVETPDDRHRQHHLGVSDSRGGSSVADLFNLP